MIERNSGSVPLAAWITKGQRAEDYEASLRLLECLGPQAFNGQGFPSIVMRDDSGQYSNVPTVLYIFLRGIAYVPHWICISLLISGTDIDIFTDAEAKAISAVWPGICFADITDEFTFIVNKLRIIIVPTGT